MCFLIAGIRTPGDQADVSVSIILTDTQIAALQTVELHHRLPGDLLCEYGFAPLILNNQWSRAILDHGVANPFNA